MAEKRVDKEIERRKPDIRERYKGVKFHQLAPGITMHPLIRSGRPCIEGTGITVANIASLRNHHNMDARQIANRLRLSGIDIIRGPLGVDDSVHLKRATGMGRVVRTKDVEFLELAAQGRTHAGIIKGIQNEHSIGDRVKYLRFVHAVHSKEEMINTINYVFYVD